MVIPHQQAVMSVRNENELWCSSAGSRYFAVVEQQGQQRITDRDSHTQGHTLLLLLMSE
jgi:hypothetical protein